MKISPAIAGFIKGIVIVVVVSVASFLANEANLSGITNPAVATLIAALASAIESSLKAKSGGTTALFGAVKLK